ncbi:cytochrome c and c1 heme-lyase [Polychaeton citri CBS 116435]|uniref:Holocytochrome c-type synthase n=1 Tax=Polychaeton citri CBS 116435 TaxID=1314669 RepID=A0A9P4UPR4_9PEZI|nr:cytochrome c and c1 heme-lyase [Polychaeton citri CBS 116435]
MADSSDPVEKCPVDHKTREKWLEAAKAKGQAATPHPHSSSSSLGPGPAIPLKYSLDNGRWEPALPAYIPVSRLPQVKQPKLYRLDNSREISTIPRALPTSHDRTPNAAERAAMPARPANNEQDTGHDADSGNWIYPSQEMFFNAMKRKGHDAQAPDMATIVPIHNAVNERAWHEIKKWEAGHGSEACGGPRLISFAGDSKALTPKARWNMFLGYQEPFDRHDWVIDRCGKEVEYVIDFYSGKGGSGLASKGLNFYLDVRPKLNTWEGVKMRATSLLGI